MSTPNLQDLASDPKTLFVANHSGGKDSQAMLIHLLKVVPREKLVVVHASLGEVEWHGALEHARAQAETAGLPFIVAHPVKTFFEMVERRFEARPEVPSWPSASCRQCTSDLKRGPIAREIRRYAKQRGQNVIVNCLGMRAEESPARASLVPFRLNNRESVGGRRWYEWLPIHALTEAEVFLEIRNAGQEAHWAYALGNNRLSCVFCIMGSANDLRNGALHRPELLAKYVAMEERTGYAMHSSRLPLSQLVLQEIV